MFVHWGRFISTEQMSEANVSKRNNPTVMSGLYLHPGDISLLLMYGSKEAVQC